MIVMPIFKYHIKHSLEGAVYEAAALGQTDVQGSVFCLGTMYFGTRVSEQDFFDLLDQYATAGGSFLDTANIYARYVPVGGPHLDILNQYIAGGTTND